MRSVNVLSGVSQIFVNTGPITSVRSVSICRTSESDPMPAGSSRLRE